MNGQGAQLTICGVRIRVSMTAAVLIVGLIGVRVPGGTGSEVRRLYLAPGGTDADADLHPARDGRIPAR